MDDDQPFDVPGNGWTFGPVADGYGKGASKEVETDTGRFRWFVTRTDEGGFTANLEVYHKTARTTGAAEADTVVEAMRLAAERARDPLSARSGVIGSAEETVRGTPADDADLSGLSDAEVIGRAVHEIGPEAVRPVVNDGGNPSEAIRERKGSADGWWDRLAGALGRRADERGQQAAWELLAREVDAAAQVRTEESKQ